MRRWHSFAVLPVVVAACVCSALLAGGGVAAAGTLSAVSARAVASGGTWGTAEEIPGAAQLNQGGNANITWLSCGSVGNCSAVGYYKGAHRQQAMVVNETNGTWRTAKEVPGIGALNHGSAQLNSVSCRSAGNCSAGGSYLDGSGHTQVFVVSETNGTWGTAKEVPGIATLNQGGDATMEALWCGSAGNCSAGGTTRVRVGSLSLQTGQMAGVCRRCVAQHRVRAGAIRTTNTARHLRIGREPHRREQT